MKYKLFLKNILPVKWLNQIDKLRYQYRPKYYEPIITSKLSNKDILNAVIAYNEYGAVCVPRNVYKRPVAQRALKGIQHEQETLNFIMKNSKGGDIIHSGTFIGSFLAPLHNCICEGYKILTFEPIVEYYRAAKITLELNNLNNVKIFNVGLGNKKAEAEMLLQTPSGVPLGGASYIVNSDVQGRKETVRIRKLDNLIPASRTVSILQLDVEGYEQQALEGGIGLITKQKPILILEDNNGITEEEWFKKNICDSLGYRYRDNRGANKIYAVNNII